MNIDVDYVINEAEIYMSYKQYDKAIKVVNDAIEAGCTDPRLTNLINSLTGLQKTLVDWEPKEALQVQPKMSFKERLIRRMIDVGRQCNLPGFVVEEARLISQFSNQDEASLLTLFELTIINAHKDGIQ